MQLVRIFVPFLNELVDISYFPEFDDLNLGDKILVKHSEKEGFYDLHDAKIISLIDSGNKEARISDRIVFSKSFSDNDHKKLIELRKKADDYFKVFSEEVRYLLIDLIPVGSELSFSEKEILFIYTAYERVDFRELLKNLSGKLRKKVQLKHIGSRDRGSIIGGFGVCGRELCCNKFLRNIPSVKIESVKNQEFFHKNSESASGLCGKLKCCLNYEVAQYKEMKKGMPKVGRKVSVNGREGKIIGLDIYNQKVKVRFEHGSEIINVTDLPKNS